MIITLFNRPRCTLLCGGVCHSFIETSVVTFSTADLREDSRTKQSWQQCCMGSQNDFRFSPVIGSTCIVQFTSIRGLATRVV